MHLERGEGIFARMSTVAQIVRKARQIAKARTGRYMKAEACDIIEACKALGIDTEGWPSK